MMQRLDWQLPCVTPFSRVARGCARSFAWLSLPLVAAQILTWPMPLRLRSNFSIVRPWSTTIYPALMMLTFGVANQLCMRSLVCPWRF
jgi:hypothetical protein